MSDTPTAAGEPLPTKGNVFGRGPVPTTPPPPKPASAATEQHPYVTIKRDTVERLIKFASGAICLCTQSAGQTVGPDGQCRAFLSERQWCSRCQALWDVRRQLDGQ